MIFSHAITLLYLTSMYCGLFTSQATMVNEKRGRKENGGFSWEGKTTISTQKKKVMPGNFPRIFSMTAHMTSLAQVDVDYPRTVFGFLNSADCHLHFDAVKRIIVAISLDANDAIDNIHSTFDFSKRSVLSI